MALVSSKWLEYHENGDLYCWWPSFKSNSQRLKAVEQHEELNHKKCSENIVNIKYKSAVYQNAVEKLKKLEDDQSVSESDADENRNRRVIKPRKIQDFIVDEESSLDSDVPLPPKLPKLTYSANRMSFYKMGQITSSRNENSEILAESPSSSRTSLLSSTPKASVVQSMNCKECSQNKELIVEVLKRLESLKHDMRFLLNNSLTNSNNETSDNLPVIETLKTIEEITNLNNAIEETQELQRMVSAVQTVGGKDISETTRRIMSRLISNKLACQFNWTGKHGKATFMDLKNIK